MGNYFSIEDIEVSEKTKQQRHLLMKQVRDSKLKLRPVGTKPFKKRKKRKINLNDWNQV